MEASQQARASMLRTRQRKKWRFVRPGAPASRKKESRLSRTVEFSEGEVSDEDQDSSHRLRRLEASRACR
jgi:hypothetical protein